MDGEIQLLVRADDAGSSVSSNLGCFRACTEGIAKSVEVMMPGAWVSHAANLFHAHPDVDIGVHLTLTSEWDAVKWRPLTQAPSLTDENGNFLPKLIPNERDERPNLRHANWSLDEIAEEFRAQIELALATFDNVSHVSSHMLKHFKDFDPRLGDLITRLCDEFNLADDAFGHGLPRIEGYPKFPRITAQRIDAFIQHLSELTSGTYIFIDHPAAPSDELSAMGHIGYEDVAEDRISCLETLLDPDLRATIDELGIELISYQDL